jgi:GTP-binding protein HflX
VAEKTGRSLEQRPPADRRRQSTYGEGIRNPRARQRALLIASTSNPAADLAELRELLSTAGVAVAGEMVQTRPEPHPDTYLGRGKLQQLSAEAKRCNANVIACDDELSPRQERSIEEAVGLPVVDRTEIILDIFAGHARSAEGKLQVELAQLQYNLSRMRGLWTHLERLGGGIGTRGPGESQIETDRRLARDRITAIRRRLDQVRSARATQRRERERASLPTVALAGYTNAGKSSLLNAITGAEVSARDRLFETLDPTTRQVEVGGRRVLMTDTVGFIRKLPHQVVEAFSATLEEAYEADLVLHVVDASMEEDDLAEMIKAVDDVLAEIGVVEQDSHLVLNKIDLVTPDRLRQLRFRHREASLVSASTREGLDDLLTVIDAKLAARLVNVDLVIPYTQGSFLGELHERGAHLERSDEADGVHVKAQVSRALAARLERFSATAKEPADEQLTLAVGDVDEAAA